MRPFLVCFTLLLLISFVTSQLSKVYVLDLRSEKTSLEAGETLSGTFTVWNAENHTVRDITYRVMLTDLNRVIVDVQYANITFDVGPDERRTFDFSYTLPKAIPTGRYYIYIHLTLKKGDFLLWEWVEVEVRGLQQYLYCNNSRLCKGESCVVPLAGVHFAAGEIPIASFDVHNPTAAEIEAKPCVTVYKRLETQRAVLEACEDFMSFPPGKSSVRLELPPMEKPESYLAALRFLNEADETVSNTLRFRYVVVGPDAEILEVRFEEAPRELKANEAFELTVKLIGPADGSDLGDGTLVVGLLDERQEACGEASSKVRLWDEYEFVNLVVKAARDCKLSAIFAEVSYEGRVLDTYAYKLPVVEIPTTTTLPPVQTTTLPPTKPAPERAPPWLLIAALLIIIVIVAVITLRVRRR